MNIKEFTSYVDDEIIARGEAYYADGRIQSLEECNGEWIADVAGSDMYTVRIVLAYDGEIEDADCNCPYWGFICKHQVAVLLAVQQVLADTQHARVQSSSQHDITKMLENADKADLVRFCTQYAKDNRAFMEELQLFFADNGDKAAHARIVIHTAIRRALDGELGDYSLYDSTKKAAEGAFKVLEQARDLLTHGDPLTCVQMCIVILDAMLPLMCTWDDISGCLDNVIGETITLITDAASRSMKDTAGHSTKDAVIDTALVKKLFSMIVSHADKDEYDEWIYWRLNLYTACVPFCVLPEVRETLEDVLLDMQSKSTAGIKQYTFIKEEVQHILYDIIALVDTPEAAEAFMLAHLGNKRFRTHIIEQAMQHNQFERALALCIEGEQSRNQNADMVDKWRTYRYTIYGLQGDISAQREMAYTLIRENCVPYYEKYKALFTPEQWPATLEALLNRLEQDPSMEPIYHHIIKTECIKPRIYAKCLHKPDALLEMYTYLLPEYKDELEHLFISSIEKAAEKAKNRNGYRYVNEYLQHFEKACGIEPARHLRDTLYKTYTNRPSFRNALRRLQ